MEAMWTSGRELLNGFGIWNEIATAPRDGKRILVWLKDENCVATALWRKVIDPEEGDPEFMWWLLEWDEWQTDDGFHDITHWMELPEGPQ